MKTTFAEANDGTAPQIIPVSAVASVERVGTDQVRVSYSHAVVNEAGETETPIVVGLLWQVDAWLSMGSTFERARDAIEAQRLGRHDENAARAASRRESADLIKRVAGAELPGENVKARITRTAALLGWDVSRTEDIWRGEARRIEAFEMDQLRALTQS